ncbi:MAG: UDP-glucose/GDP-mannose dehydrogenase family protein [Elusimicrobiota bacterium]|jgi:UDPglucose 6-dehydrogenase|nr:UDP-glucose/GDP-mannose dehydrogenase family protein [Elusimicrobiota bacterium]
MNITMIGSGYVGLVSGVCLAESGNNVVNVDVNVQKIAMLNSGKVPIYEPGLDEMIKRNVEDGRLSFSTDIDGAIKKAEVIFIAVGTPMSDSGEADLTYVFEAAKAIGKAMNGYKVVVGKSTVPVGTNDKVREIIKQQTKYDFDMASNPEFLKEGSAIDDFMKPDRIVIGTDSPKAMAAMNEIYAPFLRTFHPLIEMDIKSAEMTKYTANCFLATKISFINEISNLCERVGADINNVRKGIGADKRIGYEFLFPGVGYGGSCFPKDVCALIHVGKINDYSMEILKAVDDVNEKQKSILVEKTLKHYKKEASPEALSGLVFCIWGLSFKPRTDDIREAPALVIIDKLLSLGAKVKVFDPAAMKETKKLLGDLDGKIIYAQDQYDATKGVDALFLITEWNEFRHISIETLKNNMKGKVIFDGRNIYDKEVLAKNGFTYYAMGQVQ